MHRKYMLAKKTFSGPWQETLEGHEGFFWAERTLKNLSVGYPQKTSYAVGKKGGIMSIMRAFTETLWQDLTTFVNAFVVVYRAEVI